MNIYSYEAGSTYEHIFFFRMRSSATIGLFYRDLGARWLHDDSRWRPSKEKNDRKRGWRICTVRAPQYLSGLERAKGWECSGAQASTRTTDKRAAARLPATFLTRPSNDKFQAGRHHPYMGEFERVNRFLFDRRMPFLLLVVSHRAPRSR